jgi:hypothetical protein
MCEAHPCTDVPSSTSAAPVFQAFSSLVVTLSAMNVAKNNVRFLVIPAEAEIQSRVWRGKQDKNFGNAYRF